jgi:hypothetical protein
MTRHLSISTCLLLLVAAGTTADVVQEPIEPAVTGTEMQVAGFDDDAAVEAKRLESLAPGAGPLRVTETWRVPLTPEARAELEALGKTANLDPVTGEMLIDHIIDRLPDDWGVDAVPGVTDSYGNPIVNRVPGLPGWAQWNVDALRAEIAHWQEIAIESSPAARAEAESILGNFIGQALVRDIPIDDLVNLDDTAVVTDTVAAAIIDQLHFYENIKLVRSVDYGFAYEPTAYPPATIAFVESRGARMDEVLSVAGTLAGLTEAVPSGCYTRTTFTRGMTVLTNPNIIWQQTGDDDASSDVPIGFDFYFYSCDDDDVNFNVRVSTNGYATFFEQGGGAEDGTDFSNDPITDSLDPDGFIAPWWDDLVVATDQGNSDSVSYLTEGSLGSRVFTVEWFSMSRLGGDTTDWHFFQLKLFEATGNIELHISTDFNGDSSDNATLGIEDYTGEDGDCGPNCNNDNTDGTVPDNYRFAPIRPANDSCGNATCLEPDSAVNGTNLGATGSDITSCGYNDIHDVWYEYYAPTSGDVTFDTCAGATFDTTIAVFDACGGTELACSDDACGLQSSVTLNLATETSYYVRVAGYSGQQGNFTLTATAANQAGGDTCANATGAAGNFTLHFFTTNNSGCDDVDSCGYNNGVDEWFAWTATINCTVVADTCADSTDFDTVLSVFDACGGVELDCNDDACNLQSEISWAATSGTTYYVRVSGYNGARGNYTLQFTQIPANDNCASAELVVDGDAITANLTNATPDGDASCGSSSGNNDVWYRFNPACDGTLLVSTCGTHDTPAEDDGMDTVLSIHSGCPGTANNELECNDDWPNGSYPTSCTGSDAGIFRDSAIALAVTEGNDYYIRVSHYGSAIEDGEFFLQVNFDPLNDDCADWLPIGLGATDFCTIGAETDGPNDCDASNDIWYRWVAPDDGDLTVDLCNSDYDTYIAVYRSAVCPPANLVVCQDDSAQCDLQSYVTVGVAAGQTYQIRIGGFASNEGLGQAVLTFVPGGGLLGDMNCDGVVTPADIDPFVLALTGGQAAYEAQWPNCNYFNGDVNEDGQVSPADIDPFVQLLTGGS